MLSTFIGKMGVFLFLHLWFSDPGLESFHVNQNFSSGPHYALPFKIPFVRKNHTPNSPPGKGGKYFHQSFNSCKLFLRWNCFFNPGVVIEGMGFHFLLRFLALFIPQFFTHFLNHFVNLKNYVSNWVSHFFRVHLFHYIGLGKRI